VSLLAQVSDLTERVVEIADRYRDTDDSAVATELTTGERALVTARRAMEHAAAALAALADLA
jgi:hypothetical protein